MYSEQVSITVEMKLPGSLNLNAEKNYTSSCKSESNEMFPTFTASSPTGLLSSFHHNVIFRGKQGSRCTGADLPLNEKNCESSYH